MTNEELKKKIESILQEEIEYVVVCGSSVKNVCIEHIADALIAAGIGDVSSEKAMRELAEAFHREKCAEYDLINYKLQKAEHRAEATERKAIVLSKWLADKTRKNYPYQAWLEAAQKQAEKELAEEGKK